MPKHDWHGTCARVHGSFHAKMCLARFMSGHSAQDACQRTDGMELVRGDSARIDYAKGARLTKDEEFTLVGH